VATGFEPVNNGFAVLMRRLSRSYAKSPFFISINILTFVLLCLSKPGVVCFIG
jgi:hypothetical protein